MFICFIGNLILKIKKGTSCLFRTIIFLLIFPTFVVIVIVFVFKVPESLFLAFGVLLIFYYLALVAVFFLYFLSQVIRIIILFLKVREVKISLRGNDLIFIFGEGKKKNNIIDLLVNYCELIIILLRVSCYRLLTRQ